MKKTHYMKAAVAALALLGAATLAAAPSQAAALAPSVRSAIAKVANSPTADEQVVITRLEQVAPGSTQALVNMILNAPDTQTLAANVEAYTALNMSLLALYENLFAAVVADTRLAKQVAAAAATCTADTANVHSLVRIWCNLPSLDPYPVVQ
jgi:hypothetical protein